MATSLSLAPYNYTIINFFLFPLLYLVILNIKKKSKGKYRKKPFLKNIFFSGYSFGFGFFLFGNYWISNSLSFDESLKMLIPLTIIILPAFLGLFYGLATLISGYFINNSVSSIFMFSAIFSILDFFRGKLLTGFPWNLWSYSWHWFAEFIQLVNITGIYAFNLISLFIFTFPVVIFLKKNNFIFKFLVPYLVFIFSIYIYGNYALNNSINSTKNTKENEINFKIISPKFKIKYGLNDQDVKFLIKEIIKISDPNKNEETIFIWPEGVFSGYYFHELEKFKDEIKKNFSTKHLIIFGSNTIEKKSGNTFNSFIIINNNFDKVYQYNKTRLVPFGEFLPMQKYLENLGIKKITEGYGSFSKGEKNNNFLYSKYSILPVICYEIISPEIFQNSENKTNLIINISEDGWFGKSIGPSQHFVKAKYRAIENNSYLIRSANKGYSAFISNKGQVIKMLKPNEVGNIELRLPLVNSNKKNKNDLIFFILLITNLVTFIIFKNE